MPLLAIASAAVIAASAVGVLALPLRGSIERSVGLLLIAQSLVTLILLGAGVVLRTLDPIVLVIGALLSAAVSVGLAARTDPGASLRQASRDLRHGIRQVARSGPLLALLAIVGLSFVWRTVLAVRLPILDHDGLNYHVVTVDVWLQQGAIGRIPQQTYSDGYPANGELLNLWTMAFPGTDRLATIAVLFALPLAVLSTIGIARRLGADRMAAAFAGLLLAGMPALVVLLGTTYVDVLAAADLAVAWFFGLAAMREPGGPRRRWLLVLAGAGAGLSVGTKLPFLPLGAILGLALLADGVLRRRVRPTASPVGAAAAVSGVVRDAVLVGLPAAALGGYWYLKNLLAFGNPFWPYSVGPFAGIWPLAPIGSNLPDELLGAGQVEAVIRSWTADPWLSDYLYDVRLGGFGVGWVPLLVLAIAGLVVLVRARNAAPLVAIVVPVVTMVFAMPQGSWARYTLFVPVAVLALAAVALSRLRRRSAVALLLVAATVWSLAVASWRSNLITSPDGRSRSSLTQLVGLVGRDAGTRSRLGQWGACSALEAIPKGARVALEAFPTPGLRAFIFPHLVVGHDLDRVLTDPVEPTTDPVRLRADVGAIDAGWLVLDGAGPTMAAARGDPSTFRVVGPVCRGAELVEVLGP